MSKTEPTDLPPCEECARLKADYDRLLHEWQVAQDAGFHLTGKLNVAESDLAAARAEVERLTRERDALFDRLEVAQLSAEQWKKAAEERRRERIAACPKLRAKNAELEATLSAMCGEEMRTAVEAAIKEEAKRWQGPALECAAGNAVMALIRQKAGADK